MTEPYRRVHTPSLLTLIYLCLLSTAAQAQNNYASFELPRQENWGPLRFVDLDGDGARDIVVPHFDPGLGRELHIYRQQADGGFNARPDRIEVKTEIIAIDFADLRTDDPGMELVLLANNGVFSLSPNIAGYSGNLQLLFEWQLLASIPDQERVHFTNLVTDINNDGVPDIVVPGDDRFGLFVGRGKEQFELATTLGTLNADLTPIQRRSLETDLDANLSINPEQGVIIDLTVNTPTPFSGFVEEWQPGISDQQALLHSEQWMPGVVLAQLNDDGLKDLSYINAGDNGLGRMNIHFQDADAGIPATADWQQDLDSRGSMELVDINGDGLDDLIRLSGDGDEWNARFYINDGGRFDFQTPDQLMRFSGYEVDLEVISLEAGQMPVLNVSYYTIPVVDAIRNASIKRVQLIYTANSEGGVFTSRPASRLEESFSADNVRGLSGQMSLRYDVDGDGRKDALYITGNGTLAARRITPNLQIESQPFWEYISPRSVFEFEVLDLNADALPDLVLRHSNSTSILVARP